MDGARLRPQCCRRPFGSSAHPTMATLETAPGGPFHVSWRDPGIFRGDRGGGVSADPLPGCGLPGRECSRSAS
eukprot:1142217-Pyramimonas_sp.AAC.1